MVIGLGITGGLAQEKEVVVIRCLKMSDRPEDIELAEIGLQPMLKRNPYIKVEFVPIPSGADFAVKLNAMAAAGVLPDTYILPTNMIRAYEQAGLLLDLTPFVERDGLDMTQEAFAPFLDLAYYEGGIYVMAWSGTTHVMYYNKTFFDETGVVYPYDQYKAGQWKWEDFLETAKKLTVKDARGKTIRFGYMSGWYWDAWAWMNGAEFINPEKTKSLMDSPEMAEAIQWVADLAIVHGVAPKPGDLTTSVHAEFPSGRSAMYDCIEIVSTGMVAAEMDFDIAPMPEGKAGRADSFATVGWGVPPYAENPYEAYLVGRHLGDTEWMIAVYEETGYLQFPAGPDGWEFYLANKKMPEHASVFADSMAYARADPFEFSPKANEMRRVMNSNLDPVFLGTEAAKDVLATIAKEIDKLLQES